MAAKTTTRKPTAPKFAEIEAQKLADGARPAAAAQQAQLEAWGYRNGFGMRTGFSRWTDAAVTRAITADHTAALAFDARQAKIAAMNTVEDFEIETRSQERAFDDLCTHYSEGNAMLILAQAAALGLKVRGLRDVGGFQTMQERGRSIIKGQHQTFFIWGRKVERNADGETAPENLPLPENTNSSEAMRKARSFYPIVGLFHVSQTEDAEVAKARWAADKAAK